MANMSLKKNPMPSQDPNVRNKNFDEVALGYTEHSFAHVTKCAMTAAQLLQDLGYDERHIELAKIAGFMHDIGNVINRVDHAQSGAVMAFRILDKMGMDPADVEAVITAIGYPDDKTALPHAPVPQGRRVLLSEIPVGYQRF